MILLSNQPSHQWVDLLQEAIGDTSQDSIRRWVARYQWDPGYRLGGIRHGVRVIGLLGFYYRAPQCVEITHVAVQRRFRHQYLGTQMLSFLAVMHKTARLIAYTDDDAVGFYRRVGYQVESLGELYPGRTRYCCTRWAGNQRTRSSEKGAKP